MYGLDVWHTCKGCRCECWAWNSGLAAWKDVVVLTDWHSCHWACLRLGYAPAVWERKTGESQRNIHCINLSKGERGGGRFTYGLDVLTYLQGMPVWVKSCGIYWPKKSKQKRRRTLLHVVERRSTVRRGHCIVNMVDKTTWWPSDVNIHCILQGWQKETNHTNQLYNCTIQQWGVTPSALGSVETLFFTLVIVSEDWRIPKWRLCSIAQTELHNPLGS